MKNCRLVTIKDKETGKFLVILNEELIAEFSTLQSAEKFMLGQSYHAIIRFKLGMEDKP